MRVGFTGTRRGMSGRQVLQLGAVLQWLRLADRSPHLRHGGARGADHDAADLAWRHGYVITRHPASDLLYSLFPNETCVDPKPPLERNRIIVDHSEVLIAAPSENQEQLRSGTWATVRYARSCGIPVIMLSR